MEACCNYYSGIRFSSVHQSLTSATTAVPLLLGRMSVDFRLSHKKRARFKRRIRSLIPVKASFLPPPFDGSVSLDSLAPIVAGFTTGLAVYLSSPFFKKSSGVDGRRDADVVGEWVLFTSPTPFNRFVFLRCSLLSFDVSGGNGELLEDLNDRLMKEERHFVRLDTGKIAAAERDSDAVEEMALVYQRVCIGTEDGGIVSLDWPATLDLREERGLDTTVILVPGTPEGSMDEGVQSYARKALRRGAFPVVMNPRGCAGSPLTTARLFTAADSDDISTAVRFLIKARPWATLMGVGWGYGANMLTKYLSEVGEKTPLTAAVCINNPFDLEEITRTSPYHIALDRQLTGGLVDILRSNKELFQGRAKGFDVGKALSSESVREFEKAISMVTYGFKNIEEFYSKSSTRSVIREVKIPVLFIQNDDVAPLFSIPRTEIAENPFTSLLLCSLSPSSVTADNSANVSWCHHLASEWLTAVELGLLKGRHPLLKDMDVTVNPSKNLALAETMTVNGHHVDPMMETSNDTAITPISLQSEADPEEDIENENGSHQQDDSGVSKSGSGDVELVKDDTYSAEERSQITQTAELAMNMLDVTRPGSLKAEEKKKVLDAVDQGESIIQALQDAVPEDVRGKLTTSVSEILQSQGKKMNFEKLNLPNVTQGLKPKTHEPSKEPSSPTSQKDPYPPDQTKKTNDSVHGSNNVPGGSDNSPGGVGVELKPSEISQKHVDSSQSQPVNSNQDDSSGPGKKGKDESGSNNDNDEPLIKEKSSAADDGEKASEAGAKAGTSNQVKPKGVDDVLGDENKVDQDAMKAEQQRKEEIVHKSEDKPLEPATDQNQVASTSKEEASGPSHESPSESQSAKEENNIQNKEVEILQPAPDQTKPVVQDPIQPSFSVTQAFDALTGIDDSTQVAVNSVFGVLENMLSELEEGNKEDNENSDEKKLRDEEVNSSSEMQILDEKEANDDISSQGKHDSVSGLPENRKSSNNDITGLVNEKRLVIKKPADGNLNKHLPKISSQKHATLAQDSSYGENYQETQQNAKQLDLDTTSTLFLDYYAEEGQWMLLDKQHEHIDSVDDSAASQDTNRKVQVKSPGTGSSEENFIEPSYVILDNEKELEQTEKHDVMNNTEDYLDKVDEGCEELMHLVKVIILDSLNVEVQRRMSSSGSRQVESRLSQDIEKVADAVSLAVVDTEHASKDKNKGNVPIEKVGKLHGESIIRAISLAVQEARFLRQVLPVGVVVGSSLAALRKYFDVSTVQDDARREVVARMVQRSRKKDEETSEMKSNTDQKGILKGSTIRDGVKAGLQNINSDQVMVGAVTAALGASAMLVQQQNPQNGNQTSGIMSKASKMKGSQQKESGGLDQSNMVSSLAEKAMSIAGPVVPTKESGEVDQERIVAMLADLGQKGGILKLVGKFALLWGGIRGAMSLTDKLISFFHVSDWPLPKRIAAFIGMVLVLWSPTVVPLLPTLVQGWSTSHPSKMAEMASVIGLYVSVFILIILWGKRVRNYENSFKQYGLDFESSPKDKILDLLKGVGGGVALVMLIQCVNAMIGAAVFSWPQQLPLSFDAMKWAKGCGGLLLLVVRAFTAAACVVLVEELLFRSWLPDEVATDLGYHQSIIISGLAFALFHRSIRAIPGLWLMSLVLSGTRERSKGSLAIPIGFRSGIMASSFILQTGGFLTYNTAFPVWLRGACPLQPLSGVVGLTSSLILALILYPRPSLEAPRLRE